MAWETLATGTRWLEAYQIGESLPDAVAAKCFKAVQLSTGEEVVIRGLRVADGRRALAWRRLGAVEGAGWLRPLTVFESDGRRLEIMRAGPATTLREWGARRRATLVEVEALVRQLAAALQALHAGGVVHLNLRPEHVPVIDENGPQVILGGLELATALGGGGDGHVVLHGNPFYAPPESVGLFKHTADRTLFAWDWWTLGRLVQELVLGRHILGEILHRDVSRETQELQARAEALLAEQEGTTRAGAVEHMPMIEPELARLLRGLLASCREGRWGFEEVRRWLAKEPVKDRYELSRHDRLFVRQDRSFTVPEAAEFFAGAEAWDEGLENLFGRGDRARLRVFLEQNAAQAKAREKLEAVLKLDESTALKDLPEDLRRELIACAAWAQLAEGSAPARWRGELIDAAILRSWLRDEAQPAGLVRTRGVIAHVLAQAIGQGDADTGRWLSERAHEYEAALAWSAARGYPVDSPVVELTLLRSLFATDEELTRTQEGMKTLYAYSRDAAVEALFKKENATRYERALVVFSGSDAAKFGYVTHAQWREERYEEFRARAQRTADALYWLQLGKALRAGPIIFGAWAWLILVAAIPAGAATYAGRWVEAVALGLAPVVVALGVRGVWRQAKRGELERRLAPGESWALFDGADRCGREAQRVLGSSGAVTEATLKAALAEIRSEIGKLGFDAPREGVRAPDAPAGTWIAAIFSWVLLASVLAIGAARVGEPPIQAESVVDQRPAAEKSGAVVDGNLERKGGEETESAGEARTKVEPWTIQPKEAEVPARGDLMSEPVSMQPAEDETLEIKKVAWPFKMTPNAQTIRVRGIVDATSEQMDAAEKALEEMKTRYDEKTINVMVAVRVPTASGFGLMLYDGKAGKFTNRTVFEIAFNPLARTWLEIGGVRAFYLGAR